jgi:YD repeat-containing protein
LVPPDERFGFSTRNRAPRTSGRQLAIKVIWIADGNQQTETDARTNPTTYIYDKANRLQNIHFADTSAITYTYTFRGDKDTETDQLAMSPNMAMTKPAGSPA